MLANRQVFCYNKVRNKERPLKTGEKALNNEIDTYFSRSASFIYF